MHYVAYFAVVGSVLLGLLFFADARLGPPGAMRLSTTFVGIAPVKRPGPATQILTVRGEALEVPATALIEAASAQPRSAQASPIVLSAQKKSTLVKTAKKQKSRTVARASNATVYAQTTQNYGRVW